MRQAQLNSNALGWTFQNNEVLVHFGNRTLVKESLPANFSAIQDFIFVNQVHGNKCLNVDLHDPLKDSADALVGAKIDRALCIRTADCAPILIYDPKSRAIAAVHAGWRGVANKVLAAAFQQMQAAYASSAKDCWFFIGPHIQKQSFEVETNVRDEILTSIHTNQPQDYYSATDLPNKFNVDLNKVLHQQIFELGGGQIFSLGLDTYTQKDLHSYRRDKQNSGRLISFISLL